MHNNSLDKAEEAEAIREDLQYVRRPTSEDSDRNGWRLSTSCETSKKLFR